MRLFIFLAVFPLLALPAFVRADPVPNTQSSTPIIDLPVSAANLGGPSAYEEFPVPANYTGEFEIVYANVSAAVDPPYFYEFPSATFGDNLVFVDQVTGPPITLSDTGFFLSPTQIPLDQLNTDHYGPSSPGFTPLPGADRTFDAVNTPLPLTAGSVLTLLVGVAAYHGLQKLRPARAQVSQ